jgi:hypothetical protein
MLTRKHNSSGQVVKGSFFNRGLTKSCTKASCWLLHRFSNSANKRCFSASFMSANIDLTSLTFASSSSRAVLQSGALDIGVGLGAGVGGEAGADGRRLCGKVEDIGLLGVCIARGCGLDMVAFRLEREVVEGKTVGGGGSCDRSSSVSSAAPMLISSRSSNVSMVFSARSEAWERRGGVLERRGCSGAGPV